MAANISPTSTSTFASSTSITGSSPTSSSTSLNSDHAQKKKPGRPNKWSETRKRTLARLYLYTTLSPEDIRRVLEEKDQNFVPLKGTTDKTLNSLLDKNPRWLRPKNREEMDQRLSGLSALKAQRKSRRKQPESGKQSQNDITSAHAITSIPFSETPIKDLLAHVPCGTFQTPRGLSIATPASTQSVLVGFSGTWPSRESLEFSSKPLPRTPEAVPVRDCNMKVTSEPCSQLGEGALDSEGSCFEPIKIVQPHLGSDIETSCTNWPQQEGSLPSGLPSETLEPVTPRSRADIVPMSMATLSTYLSTSSIKQRIPSGHSSSYIKWVARLKKGHSLSNSSAATIKDAAYPMSVNNSDGWTLDKTGRDSVLVSSQWEKARLLLAGCVLELDHHIKRQGVCLPGLSAHDSGTCWCLTELETQGRLWVHRHGLMGRANTYVPDPPTDMTCLDIRSQDAFGHTVLHMLAARGASIECLKSALGYVDGRLKNTSDQTFLHVLPRGYLKTLLEDQPEVFITFLLRLKTWNISIHDCDIFGRSFFHLLTREAAGIFQLSNSIQKTFEEEKMRGCRNAFGWLPNLDSTSEVDDNLKFYLQKFQSPSEYCCEISRAYFSNKTEPYESCGDHDHRSKEYYFSKHAHLLRTARVAVSLPLTEDFCGRNGLHCLAEASLKMSIGQSELLVGSSQKRKHNQPEGDSSTRLTLRYQLVQGLIEAAVNVNHYDKAGDTVLMAFVTHLQDGEDDQTLMKILQSLIAHGANINLRNRQGESALHIAVRLGRKVATVVLLEEGANVHARTIAGKGILATGETHYFRARDDPSLYASIMACMALCLQYGAVAAPNLVQEWTAKDVNPPNSHSVPKT